MISLLRPPASGRKRWLPAAAGLLLLPLAGLALGAAEPEDPPRTEPEPSEAGTLEDTLGGGGNVAARALARSSRDEARRQIGRVARFHLEPELDGARQLEGGRKLWTRSLVLEGATFLKLRFRSLRLRPSDRLEIHGSSGLVETLSLDGPRDGGPFWSLTIPGGWAELELSFHRPYGEPPFEIDRIALGDVPMASFSPGTRAGGAAVERRRTEPRADEGKGASKSLCGPGDFEDVVCYQSDALKWANIRATAGIVGVEGDRVFWCTGVAVSPRDHVLTTESCLADTAACRNAEFVFGYYRDGCGVEAEIAPGWVGYRCSETVATSPFEGFCEPDADHLDFSLHTAEGFPTTTWGYADPSALLPASGDPLYIVQHASGRPLEIVHGDGADVEVEPSVLRYYGTLDTESTSVGSPIFQETDHRLVGLHHCGGCSSPGVGNRGVPTAEIRSRITEALCEDGDFLEAGPPIGFEPVTGNGDAVLDPDEIWRLIPTVRNVSCDRDAQGIAATIEVAAGSAPIELLDSTATFPDLAAGTTAAGTAVRFRLLAAAPCAGAVRLDLGSITAGAAGPFAGQAVYAELEVGEVPETTLFHSTFGDGLEPPWTVESVGDGEGESASWTLDDPGGRQLLDPPFAIVDSEHLGPGFTMDEALISPAVDTTGYTNASLRFRHDFRWYDQGLDERADVDVRSSATGGAWTQLARFEGGDASGEVELDLGAYSAADVQVRFRYWNAEWEWWWAVDDVRIRGDDGRRCFTGIFLDGFESGDPNAWSTVVP